MPQQIFEKNFQRVRKPRHVRKGLLELVQAEDFDRLAGERAFRSGVERICAAHHANPIKTCALSPAARDRYDAGTRGHLEHRSAARPLAPGPPSFCAHLGERAARLLGALVVRQQRQRLGRDVLGRAVVLDQLGHNAPAGNEIDHRDVIDQQEPAAEAVGQGRQPVDDDHRPAVQRGLNGRGARRCDRHIRNRQHVVGSREHFDGPGAAPLRARKQAIVERRRPRDDELRVAAAARRSARRASRMIGSSRSTSFGRLPGQQRDDRPSGIETELAQKRCLSVPARARGRRADGRRTARARRRRDRSVPRTEKSPARGRRAASSPSSGSGARPRAAG